MHFDGVCPFVLCLETRPHDHPECPECGALRYGNSFCPTCRAYLEQEPWVEGMYEMMVDAKKEAIIRAHGG